MCDSIHYEEKINSHDLLKVRFMVEFVIFSTSLLLQSHLIGETFYGAVTVIASCACWRKYGEISVKYNLIIVRFSKQHSKNVLAFFNTYILKFIF